MSYQLWRLPPFILHVGVESRLDLDLHHLGDLLGHVCLLVFEDVVLLR